MEGGGIFFRFAAVRELREIVGGGVGVSRNQIQVTIVTANIVEEKISAGRPVRRAAADADAFHISPAEICRDDVRAGVADNFLIPNVDARPAVI